ncbi:MAG: ABC transporter ATP-binding protein [Thermaurantimonas sp.]|uniref:ABC transporter ATP-binding protein n=1 Tax=Thermaurantimonas sp. TaxID=2681568 RepID=UPI00391BC2FF
MSILLETHNISKKYGNHQALSSVSLQVKKGAIFGLLGPNGAGKTTLIRIINQIISPDSGTVYFDGEHLNPSHQARIGYLPEERGLYRTMKVGEQALYLAGLKGMPTAEAKKALRYWFERLDITDWWDKKVEELSKGMAQKVQFVITVLHKPELLILDEPFSGFDPVNEGIIRDELLELHRQGTTIIFSTHRMDTVEELCQDIAMIDRSRLVLSGPLHYIKRQYARHQWEIVLDPVNVNALTLPNDFHIISHYTTEYYTHLLVQDIRIQGLSPLLQWLVAQPGLQLHSIREVLPAMKDIFIDVAKNNTSAA